MLLRKSLSAFAVLLAACFAVGAAIAAPAVESVRIDSPAPPQLSTTAGGSIPAHSDYVRITYVTASGETLPSGESVMSQPANALTIIHSPSAAMGAIGYNVYAVQNNGGNGAGHTLQNRSPLPLGTDYAESVGGWSKNGAAPPAKSSVTVAIDWVPTTYEISPSGGYFDASSPGGARAAMLLPRSDAPTGTTLTVQTTVGLPPQLSSLPSVANANAHPAVVVETVRFAFNHDVTLSGSPAFKFTATDANAIPPCQLELYDGTTGVLVAAVPGFAYGPLAFLSNYEKPFRAIGGRAYYAVLVSRAADSRTVQSDEMSAPIVMPPVAGIGVSVLMPAGKFTGFSSTVFASSEPVGLPPLAGSSVRQPLYYATLVVGGTASFSGSATVKVTLPASLAARRRVIALAAYDSGFSRSGWFTGIRPSDVGDRSLTFLVKLPEFLAWRRYGVALYESNAAHTALSGGPSYSSRLKVNSSVPTVVVVGDSISHLTIIPPSSVGCAPGWGPLPECQYSDDPNLNWPGVFAELTGYNVINLSALGVTTIKDQYTGPSMLDLMVPQIPRNAQFVVCQCGINDLSLNENSPATSANAGVLVNAIHARAPRARIVFIGLRCWTSCGKPGINAWNEALKRLAGQYGAFVDIIPMGPEGASAVFPDGSHPNPATARLIAVKVSDAIRQLERESGRP